MGINVAVTGLNATDNPAPGLGVIRSLHHPERWDGTIIGLAYDVYDTGVYDETLLDETYMVPYPNQGVEQIFDRLMYIHEHEHIDVIIPTLDSELLLYQKLEPRLKEAGIALYLPDEEVVKKRAKSRLPEFCQEHDIPTAKTIVINNPTKLDDAIEELGYPLYVKGVFYEAFKCQTKDETLSYFEKLRLRWGLPVLVQESLNGEEFDVCAVGDRHGELLGAIPIRKLRLTDKGKAWVAVTIKNQELYALSCRVLKALHWSGPCELEIMQDFNTKEFLLLEINPRFPSWIYLGTGADQNLPKLVVDLALGKEVNPLPQAKSGVTFVRHATDLVCPLGYIESLTMHGELHYHDLNSNKG
jgi:carbamoyl-phosphate synthase large subunit